MTLTEQSSFVVDEAYRRPVTFALVLHVATTVLALLVLDGGQLARIFGGASAGFWLGVAIILCRRPFGPRSSDFAYIRFGLLPAFVASMAAALIVPGILPN